MLYMISASLLVELVCDAHDDGGLLDEIDGDFAEEMRCFELLKPAEDDGFQTWRSTVPYIFEHISGWSGRWFVPCERHTRQPHGDPIGKVSASDGSRQSR